MTATQPAPTIVDPREFHGEEFRRDPFPIYKRLRDYSPLYFDRGSNRWILSRYEDIVAAFQDNEGYDRAMYDPEGPYKEHFGEGHVFGPNILEYGNSAKHKWMRNVVADQFVGKRLEAFMPVIHMIADELVERIWTKSADQLTANFAEAGEVELVKEFSEQFPVRVISNMLGLPREDEDRFVGWYQALILGLGAGENYVAGVKARDEMWDYIDPLIEEREANPTDDLLSRIVHAELGGKRMSVLEVKGFVALLLAAGGDTTDKAISNMWYHMLYTRPDQFEAVKQDPELWTNVFSEMMRFDPVVHFQFRKAMREIPLHGAVIPWGASVTFYLGAGGRDERVFKDPDTFDIFRDDLHMDRELRSGQYLDGKAGHLGFGMGQHFCMGYAMARQEAIIASKKLAAAMPNARPKFPTHEGVTSPPAGNFGFRAPRELWIQFDAR